MLAGFRPRPLAPGRTRDYITEESCSDPLSYPKAMARSTTPRLPAHAPTCFRATVHGSVFASRSEHVDRIRAGDELLLIPDPPVQDDPEIWVHLRSGDPVGHLPPEIEAWLAPWMMKGGRATARAIRVSGRDVPSWRRLLIEVTCVT